MKQTDGTPNWVVYSEAGGAGRTLSLNLTNAFSADNAAANWGSVPTSSLFTVTNNSSLTNASKPHIAYCFHSVAGYSKIGTYEGLGTSTVTVSNVGFKPSFIIIKNVDAVANWNIYDVERSTVTDRANKILYPNLANSEPSATSYYFDMNDNGFIVSATNHEQHNKAGRTYLYMAIK